MGQKYLKPSSQIPASAQEYGTGGVAGTLQYTLRILVKYKLENQNLLPTCY